MNIIFIIALHKKVDKHLLFTSFLIKKISIKDNSELD